ncbi:MAG: Asp23/Gls24 family envelope stress response protein [Nocardioidaceae bacterium]
MTESTALDPGQRGNLTIADRAINKLASHAASSVVGVVESGSTLDKLVGRRLPRTASDVRGQLTRVGVEIAVEWPLPLSEVAKNVQSAVAQAVSSLSGLTVVAVDVSVSRVEKASNTPARRVE